ncbi:DUF3189 family protein [Halobacillus salinarum]|uniref:DUF3189 family protein n=1 Tax=Halobacillus salinarum TaxID=2932257 RepID=A0ABY4EFR6_9BACI|nr:DUF3189 family protein [Halobacillus salinarum]UOQ43315.1 DUF3189 family protein [Halobacillus salinarum]
MIFIYNDYGGTHTTSMAAAFHLELVAPEKELTKEEVLSIPYFNQLTKKDFGRLIHHGNDSEGNPVYTLGRKSSKLVVPALKEFGMLLFDLFKMDEQIVFSNTSPTVPFVMTIGGGLSRGLGLDFLGVPLLVKGAKRNAPLIYDLVQNTKREAKENMKDKILVLDNQQYKI